MATLPALRLQISRTLVAGPRFAATRYCAASDQRALRPACQGRGRGGRLDLGLENKVALVAGGSSGLGLAIAKELAREGAHIAIGARDRDRLAAAERSVKEVARGRVHTTSVDITDRVAARHWVDEVAADFGALHVV